MENHSHGCSLKHKWSRHRPLLNLEEFCSCKWKMPVASLQHCEIGSWLGQEWEKLYWRDFHFSSATASFPSQSTDILSVKENSSFLLSWRSQVPQMVKYFSQFVISSFFFTHSSCPTLRFRKRWGKKRSQRGGENAWDLWAHMNFDWLYLSSPLVADSRSSSLREQKLVRPRHRRTWCNRNDRWEDLLERLP